MASASESRMTAADSTKGVLDRKPCPLMNAGLQRNVVSRETSLKIRKIPLELI